MGHDGKFYNSIGGDRTSERHSRPMRGDSSIGGDKTHGGDGHLLTPDLDAIEKIDLTSRFQSERTLGRGGMGEVVLAVDTRLGRRVAIKRILGAAADNRVAVARFLTEAKAIAALNHPNIVQIYEFGRTNDGPFLIMEYVDGGNLSERCKAGLIPVEQAINLTCRLCDALTKAHGLGIIHRNIKPANVLLTKDGIPKLTDFGLAKDINVARHLTMTNAVMGTPDFMPPEQQQDASLVDHRSDLWSLAATFYQMVTGRSPQIIRLRELPPRLEKVLATALEEEKASRFQSAAEFREALQAAREGNADPQAPGPIDGGLREGECAACGKVHADLTRKFCRTCGESLRSGCLQCQAPIPVWDTICGECGANQSPLLKSRSLALAGEQKEAESKLASLDFDAAREIAERQQREPDPRHRHHREWAVAFLRTIEESKRVHIAALTEAHVAAARCEAEWDYPGAISHLEAIPPPMRTTVLPGFDTATQLLDRFRRNHIENQALEARIDEGLAGTRGELLADIKTLLARLPNREDLSLRATELEEQLLRERDEALTKAFSMFDTHQYEAAEQALATMDEAVANESVFLLRNAIRRALAQVAALAGTIWSHGSSDEQVDLRNPLTKGWIEELLQLVPDHEGARRLRDRLAAHHSAVEKENLAAIHQAQACLDRSDYDAAAAAATSVDSRDASEELRSLAAVAKQKSQEVRALREKLDVAMNARDYDAADRLVAAYTALDPHGVAVRAIAKRLALQRTKLASDRQDLIRRAGALLSESRYKEAVQLLDGSDDSLCTEEVLKLRAEARQKNDSVEALTRDIKQRAAAQKYDEALLSRLNDYLALKPKDRTALLLQKTCREHHERNMAVVTSCIQQIDELLAREKWSEALDLLLKPGGIDQSEMQRLCASAIAMRERLYQDELQRLLPQIKAISSCFPVARLLSLLCCVACTVLVALGPTIGIIGYPRVILGVSAASSLLATWILPALGPIDPDACRRLLSGHSEWSSKDHMPAGCLGPVALLIAFVAFLADFFLFCFGGPAGATLIGLLVGCGPAAVCVATMRMRWGVDGPRLRLQEIENSRRMTCRHGIAYPDHPIHAIEKQRLDAAGKIILSDGTAVTRS